MPSAAVMPETGDVQSDSDVLRKSASSTSILPWDIPVAWKKKVNSVFIDNWYQAFMTAMLMISLFMPDSWILGNAANSEDDRLYAVLLAVFIIFMIETIIMSLFVDGYFLRYNFWLDLIGNISMIIDIGWIADSFIPDNTIATQGSIVRATRAAKLAARYGRLLRLIRLIRFAKKLPCYKTFVGGDMDDAEPTLSAIKRVSEELGDTLAVRTSILILVLVIVLPFLGYNTVDYSAQSWITNFKLVAKNETATVYDLQNLARKCNNYYMPKDSVLSALYIESPYMSSALDISYPTRKVLRHGNVLIFDSSYFVSNSTLLHSGSSAAQHYLTTAAANGRDNHYGYVEFQVSVELDNTVPNQMNAMFNILTLIIVIVLLLGFTSSFNSSVNRLVVKPLEKMMTTLRKSALMMIKTLETIQNTTEKDKEKTEEETKKKGGEEEEDTDENNEEENEAIESAMLEKMIEKLARIMTHVIPSNHEDIVVKDANIDSNTASWLNQAYNNNASSSSTKAGGGRTGRRASVKALQSLDEEEDGEEGGGAGGENKAITDEITLAETVPVFSTTISAATKEALTTWNFDVLPYSHDELHQVVRYLFTTALPLLKTFRVSDAMLYAFLTALSERYINTNTYHNYHHAVDVCFTAYRLLVVPGLTYVFTPLEVYSLLVASLAHDVGHIGMNNMFLIKTKHSLALTHNDRSPLENMHCVILYELIHPQHHAERNIFHALEEKQWRDARKFIITVILGTDMTHHFDQISKTQLFYEMHGEDTKAFCTGHKDEMVCFQEEKNRMFILELVLHCADVSNPYKPFTICQKWADLVAEEFCAQGDKEKELGVEISPMCDRNTMNLYNMQLGFIEFVISPLIIAVVNVFPSLHEIAQNMLNNFQSWGELKKLEIMNAPVAAPGAAGGDVTAPPPPPVNKMEECQKLDERMQKFRDKLRAVSTYKDLPARRRSSNKTIASLK